MSETRRSTELDGAARLVASARARLAGAALELRLPEGHRLTEWQRRTILAWLAGLVRSVEDELRSSLAARLANPNFTERAKPEAVEKARADHEAKAAEAERLRAAVERLG